MARFFSQLGFDDDGAAARVLRRGGWRVARCRRSGRGGERRFGGPWPRGLRLTRGRARRGRRGRHHQCGHPRRRRRRRCLGGRVRGRPAGRRSRARDRVLPGVGCGGGRGLPERIGPLRGRLSPCLGRGRFGGDRHAARCVPAGEFRRAFGHRSGRRRRAGRRLRGGSGGHQSTAGPPCIRRQRRWSLSTFLRHGAEGGVRDGSVTVARVERRLALGEFRVRVRRCVRFGVRRPRRGSAVPGGERRLDLFRKHFRIARRREEEGVLLGRFRLRGIRRGPRRHAPVQHRHGRRHEVGIVGPEDRPRIVGGEDRSLSARRGRRGNAGRNGHRQRSLAVLQCGDGGGRRTRGAGPGESDQDAGCRRGQHSPNDQGRAVAAVEAKRAGGRLLQIRPRRGRGRRGLLGRRAPRVGDGSIRPCPQLPTCGEDLLVPATGRGQRARAASGGSRAVHRPFLASVPVEPQKVRLAHQPVGTVARRCCVVLFRHRLFRLIGRGAVFSGALFARGLGRSVVRGRCGDGSAGCRGASANLIRGGVAAGCDTVRNLRRLLPQGSRGDSGSRRRRRSRDAHGSRRCFERRSDPRFRPLHSPAWLCSIREAAVADDYGRKRCDRSHDAARIPLDLPLFRIEPTASAAIGCRVQLVLAVPGRNRLVPPHAPRQPNRREQPKGAADGQRRRNGEVQARERPRAAGLILQAGPLGGRAGRAAPNRSGWGPVRRARRRATLHRPTPGSRRPGRAATERGGTGRWRPPEGRAGFQKISVPHRASRLEAAERAGGRALERRRRRSPPARETGDGKTRPARRSGEASRSRTAAAAMRGARRYGPARAARRVVGRFRARGIV